MTPVLIIICIVFLILAAALWAARRASQRRQHIRSAALPKGLYDKLRQRHPQLALKDCALVAQGLRQFFMAYSRSRHQTVSMPSQVADDLWHEFILHTRAYDLFCQNAFGRFFHHAPAAALAGGNTQMNEGLRRCWWHACREDNINPVKPARLPLLFALDAKMNIVNGFHYAADCSANKLRSAAAAASAIYCGGDFSSSAIDGSTAGFSDSGNGSGGSGADASSDGGGCGGGGGD